MRKIGAVERKLKAVFPVRAISHGAFAIARERPNKKQKIPLEDDKQQEIQTKLKAG